LINRLFSKLFLPVLWVILIQVLLCLPGSSLPDDKSGLFAIPYLDKLVHITLFGVFVALWCYYFYRKFYSVSKLAKLFFGIFLLASFNGILLEYIQLYFIPGRSFDKGDIIADLMGAGFSYGICNIKLLKMRP
jgi:VanZ family protein